MTFLLRMALLPLAGTAVSQWTPVDPENATFCGRDLGIQEASSIADCERNCWIDPRCRFVSLVDGQCSWSRTCAGTKLNGSVSMAKETVYPKGYFWSNTLFTVSGKVLKRKSGVSLDEAMDMCATDARCTCFSFDAPSPASTHGASDVVFYNAANVIDPDVLSTKWVYYKNSTQIPFCDLQVSPSMLTVNSTNNLTFTWKHCEGEELRADLALPGGIIVDSVRLHPGSRAHTTLTVTNVPDKALGQNWSVLLHSGDSMLLPQPLIIAQLQVVDQHCPTEDGWAMTLAGDVAARNCSALNASVYAAGIARRACSEQGTWLPTDTAECSSGGWDQQQLAFLEDPSVRELELDQHNSQSLLHYVMYFPGSKVYGVNYGTFSGNPGCVSNGDPDVPGNMVHSAFRRMIAGELLAKNAANCSQWSMQFQFTIGTESATAINNQATLHYDRGTLNVTTDSPRLRVRIAQLQYHGISFSRLEITDSRENMCLESLLQTCAEAVSQGGLRCELCAAMRLPWAQTTPCGADSNWQYVIKYWCNCMHDSESGCGGPVPENISSAHGLAANVSRIVEGPPGTIVV